MSRDPRVDAYIAQAQPFAQPILEHVRTRVHSTVPAIEETIKWRMPAYMLGGKIVLITAAFKAHMALNFWRGQEMESSLASVGAMGQFGRIESAEDLPADEELDRLIREAAELSASAATPRKTKAAPKPSPQMHPEFAEALGAAPKARAALESFPPSAQRDYFEWISEAKQDSTRKTRIATAIEWLCEGKRRHWKYEKC